MSIKYLFRGRHNGETWFYGDLFQNGNAIETDGIDLGGDVFIFPKDGYDSPDHYSVEPATVSIWTGGLDKNGTKVFQDDVCRFTALSMNDVPFVGVCVWDAENGRIVFDCGAEFFEWNTEIHSIEVIGNVHDQPDFLDQVGFEEGERQ